ncbi:unnamed protein product [Rotaria sp. Silwood2]|nr:unnamed protein product [Rotaria sp. Silwood2]CAF3409100.1 unnamed protein product [Rotaria sp. Silwood2]CAF4641148.1 unnamed protein product [Rotaria sp. Silwood2]
MGARMFQPSSGRNNFDAVSEERKTTNNKELSPKTIKQTQNVTESQNRTEIEAKTKDAIKNATKSPLPT